MRTGATYSISALFGAVFAFFALGEGILNHTAFCRNSNMLLGVYILYKNWILNTQKHFFLPNHSAELTWWYCNGHNHNTHCSCLSHGFLLSLHNKRIHKSQTPNVNWSTKNRILLWSILSNNANNRLASRTKHHRINFGLWPLDSIWALIIGWNKNDIRIINFRFQKNCQFLQSQSSNNAVYCNKHRCTSCWSKLIFFGRINTNTSIYHWNHNILSILSRFILRQKVGKLLWKNWYLRWNNLVDYWV